MSLPAQQNACQPHPGAAPACVPARLLPCPFPPCLFKWMSGEECRIGRCQETFLDPSRMPFRLPSQKGEMRAATLLFLPLNSQMNGKTVCPALPASGGVLQVTTVRVVTVIFHLKFK